MIWQTNIPSNFASAKKAIREWAERYPVEYDAEGKLINDLKLDCPEANFYEKLLGSNIAGAL